MQMTLILNICEKLALAFGIIGLVGFVAYLIIAIVLSVKNKSIEPLYSVFPQEQPWYLSFMYMSIISLFWLNIKEGWCKRILKNILLLIEQVTLTAGLIVTGNAFALLVVGVIFSILESVLNIHGNPLNDFKKSGALVIII